MSIEKKKKKSIVLLSEYWRWLDRSAELQRRGWTGAGGLHRGKEDPLGAQRPPTTFEEQYAQNGTPVV